MNFLIKAKLNKYLERVGIALLIIGFLVMIIGVVLFQRQETFDVSQKIDSTKIAHLGDFIGGIAGALWSLASVILFYVALSEQRRDLKINQKALKAQVKSLRKQIEEFELQREELQETRKVFKEQSETFQIQRFENSFFQLTSLHHEIIDKIYFEISPLDVVMTFHKRTALRELASQLKTALRDYDFREEATDSDRIHINFRDPVSLEDHAKSIQQASNNFFNERTNSLLGHYFGNLYQLFKYIDTSTLVDAKSKMQFIDIACAQLSNDELYLILFNAMSVNHGFPKFLILIKKYDLLKNFDFRLITSFQKEVLDRKLEELKE